MSKYNKDQLCNSEDNRHLTKTIQINCVMVNITSICRNIIEINCVMVKITGIWRNAIQINCVMVKITGIWRKITKNKDDGRTEDGKDHGV
jgi:hypothetical protein